jgi:hypothetical protein
MSIAHPTGHYHFLKGGAPFSSGVIADPGYEIVRVTLGSATEWCHGFDHIRSHLTGLGLEVTSLCAIELRAPAPMTLEEFRTFNVTYREKLSHWDLLVDGVNPVARTNVAPMYSPPVKTELYAFSYTVPTDDPVSTFVISGAADSQKGKTPEERVVCFGQTDVDSMRKKAAFVVNLVEQRMLDLGGSWDSVSSTNFFSVHGMDGVIDGILGALGPAAFRGTVWHHAWPPLVDLKLEMDARAIRQEIFAC